MRRGVIPTAPYSVDIYMESGETRAAFERLTSGPKRVLLVQDHAWFREALAYLLNLDPGLLVVQQASSLDELGEDVVDHDVVLVDLDVFHRRDTQLVSRLRECSSRAPLLALTSTPDFDLHLRTLEGGADMLLLKSVSVQEILRSLKHLTASDSGAEHTRRGYF